MSEVNYNADDVIDLDQSKMNKLKKKGPKIVFSLIILVFIAVTLMKGIFIVEQGENAVILRFGQVDRVETEGLNFAIPYIEKVYIVDVEQTYKMEYGFYTASEGSERSTPVYNKELQEATVIVGASDNNASIILLNLVIQYKVENPANLLFKVDDLEGTIRIALEDAIRSTYQTYTLEQARTEKSSIDAKILPALQDKLNSYESGIRITQVKTQNVELLNEVQKAYQQKENANQYKRGRIEEAEKYVNTIIPNAEAEATRLKEEAAAYTAKRIAEANASIAQFEALYQEYLRNPAVVKEKYYLEAMEQVIQKNDIVINGTNNGDLNIYYNVDDTMKKKTAE